MELVRRDLVRNGPGSVKIVPVEDDDMWHAYNLISVGDVVQAVTVRKVLREMASGGRDAERVKLKLEIKVEEVLDAPSVMALIKDTKGAQEVRVLKEFFTMLSNDTDRCCYGPKHVEVAHERMAIQDLLITDTLFRNSDVETRKKYVKLVESDKDSGGTVYTFSTMHVSGEQLARLTGVAAILRFVARVGRHRDVMGRTLVELINPSAG